MPPIATQANEIDACDSENAPVAAAATANLNVVRPDASFINASPSSTYISCLGMPARPASALTATASVGDSTAASANAAASGNRSDERGVGKESVSTGRSRWGQK